MNETGSKQEGDVRQKRKQYLFAGQPLCEGKLPQHDVDGFVVQKQSQIRVWISRINSIRAHNMIRFRACDDVRIGA